MATANDEKCPPVHGVPHPKHHDLLRQLTVTNNNEEQKERDCFLTVWLILCLVGDRIRSEVDYSQPLPPWWDTNIQRSLDSTLPQVWGTVYDLFCFRRRYVHFSSGAWKNVCPSCSNTEHECQDRYATDCPQVLHGSDARDVVRALKLIEKLRCVFVETETAKVYRLNSKAFETLLDGTFQGESNLKQGLLDLGVSEERLMHILSDPKSSTPSWGIQELTNPWIHSRVESKPSPGLEVKFDDMLKDAFVLQRQATEHWEGMTNKQAIPLDDFIEWYCGQEIECLPKDNRLVVRKVLLQAGLPEKSVDLTAFSSFMTHYGPLDKSYVKAAVLCKGDGTKQSWWNPCPGLTATKTKEGVKECLAALRQKWAVKKAWFLEPHRKGDKHPSGFSLIFEAENDLGFSEYVIINTISGVFVREGKHNLFFDNLVASLARECKFKWIQFKMQVAYTRDCDWNDDLFSFTNTEGECLATVGATSAMTTEKENRQQNQAFMSLAAIRRHVAEVNLQRRIKGIPPMAERKESPVKEPVSVPPVERPKKPPAPMYVSPFSSSYRQLIQDIAQQVLLASGDDDASCEQRRHQIELLELLQKIK
jgi:hypothetical protein